MSGMDDPVSKARRELATIDAEIAALQQRRGPLRQFVELADSLYGAPTVSRPVYSDVSPGAASGAAGQKAPVKVRAIAVCESHIAVHGPTRTHDLLAVVQSAGIEIGSADPQNALSVLLSKDGRFVPDRKAGWSLKAGHEEETPQVAPTTAGS